MRLWLYLALAVNSIILLAFLGFGGYTASEQSAALTKDLEIDTRNLARSISAGSANNLLLANFDQIENRLLRHVTLGSVQELVVADSQGRILVQVVRGPNDQPQSVYDHVSQQMDLSQPELRTPAAYTLLLPIERGELLGWVRVSASLSALDSLQRHIWTSTLLASLLTVVLTAGLLAVFLRKTTAALGQATQFAGNLIQQRGASLPAINRIVEVQQLTRALNSAAQALATQFLALQDSESEQQRISAMLRQNEQARLKTLKSLDILDTLPEERFDRLARIARRTFGVPIALVSFVDENRQWFKSCMGLDIRQTSRDVSFCGHAIQGDGVFIIPNTLEDRRFADNPLVLNHPHIRFYAGCPLAVNGHILGTLCIIDQIPRSFGKEDIEALQDLASMVESELSAVQLAGNLETQTIALEQAQQRELEIGNRIQQTLLVAPPTQGHAGLWISAFSQASKGIDGDFFEMIEVGTDAVDIIVGDVMGKGVPAALLGAATKLQFSRSMAELLVDRNPMDGPPQPKDIVGLVNRIMAPHLQALDAFVTLAYLRIDVKANSVTWVGCGHEESLLVDGRGNARLLGNQHTPIGLFLDEQYGQDVCALGADDAIFLCSDGASDALLESGGRLGRDIIDATIKRHMLAHRTPAMALHALRRDLLLDQVKLSDDLTMVMLTRYDVGRNIARLEAPVSLQSLKAVREFVAAQAAILGEEVAGLLTVAAVEVLTNVIRHAQGLVPQAPVELLIEQSPAGLQLDFKYLGQRFEPTADAPETDFGAFPEGGFGLHIIQGASDHVDYLYQDGVNTVRMLVRSA